MEKKTNVFLGRAGKRQVYKETVKDQTRRIPKCLRYISTWFAPS